MQMHEIKKNTNANACDEQRVSERGFEQILRIRE